MARVIFPLPEVGIACGLPFVAEAWNIERAKTREKNMHPARAIQERIYHRTALIENV